MLDDLIDVLDRQARSLLDKKGAGFFRHLSQFVKFIHEEPRLAECLEDMRKDATEVQRFYVEHDEKFVPQVVEFRRKLVELAPEVDDSSMTREEGNKDPHRWRTSLAKFDFIAEGKGQLPWEIDTAKDTTRTGKLLGIVEYKIERLRNNKEASEQASASDKRRSILRARREGAQPSEPKTSPEGPESAPEQPPLITNTVGVNYAVLASLERDVANVKSRHIYEYRKIVDRKFQATGLLLDAVAAELRQINSEPTPIPSDEREAEAQAHAHFEQMLREYGATIGRYAIEKLLYEETALTRDEQDSVGSTTKAFKSIIGRIYEDLRARVGKRLSLLALFDRFKHRAEWHDRARLFNLAGAAQRKREEALTAELALWLFDQGFSPVSKPMMAGLEPDLTDPSFKFNLYVEAKQYDGAAKEYLVKGFYQLWDTVSGLRGTPYQVKEAFYVVFRRGGPRYVLPEAPIAGEGWIAHLRLIDIAPAKTRGSRAVKPIAITLEDLLPAGGLTAGKVSVKRGVKPSRAQKSSRVTAKRVAKSSRAPIAGKGSAKPAARPARASTGDGATGKPARASNTGRATAKRSATFSHSPSSNSRSKSPSSTASDVSRQRPAKSALKRRQRGKT